MSPYVPSTDRLISLLALPTQERVQAFVCAALDALGRPYEQDAYGNIISDPRPERPKAWMVAHCDTVHTEHTDDQPLEIVRRGDTLKAYWRGPHGTQRRVQTGIGGDDKCGVWAVLEACHREAAGGPPVGALFTADEEIGCVGARALDLRRLASARCFLQLDRREVGDAIDHTNGLRIWTPAFEALLAEPMAEHGFSPARGTSTDIGPIAEATRRPAINISAGYHHAHTSDEFVVVPESLRGLAFAFAIVDAVEAHPDELGRL